MRKDKVIFCKNCGTPLNYAELRKEHGGQCNFCREITDLKAKIKNMTQSNRKIFSGKLSEFGLLTSLILDTTYVKISIPREGKPDLSIHIMRELENEAIPTDAIRIEVYSERDDTVVVEDGLVFPEDQEHLTVVKINPEDY